MYQSYSALILPPFPPSLFFQRFFASITELSSPLFDTSVVNHLLNDLLILMYSVTSTPSGISPTSYNCSLLKPCSKPSYTLLILIRSPSLCWKTQHSVLPSSSTIISSHIPTHLLISIPEPANYTKGSICQFPPIYPLNLHSRATMA